MVSDEGVKRAILSFMSTRCAVSSQHKLPCEEDIMNTVMADFVGRERLRIGLHELIASGAIRQYGPYLSDRAIDVM